MYASTRNPALDAGLSEALLQGLAPDGGLYVPRAIATVDARNLDGLRRDPCVEQGPTVRFPEIDVRLLPDI